MKKVFEVQNSCSNMNTYIYVVVDRVNMSQWGGTKYFKLKPETVHPTRVNKFLSKVQMYDNKRSGGNKLNGNQNFWMADKNRVPFRYLQLYQISASKVAPKQLKVKAGEKSSWKLGPVNCITCWYSIYNESDRETSLRGSLTWIILTNFTVTNEMLLKTRTN